MTELLVATTDALSVDQLAAVHQLMIDAFTDGFDDDDWQHCLGGTHVLLLEGSNVISHASVVQRRLEVAGTPFDTGYVEAVATLPSLRGGGHGSRVMKEIAAIISRTFELGALATGGHAFYERLGWERWRGSTMLRGIDGLVPTPDADDAIMVLRVRPDRPFDLSSPLSCELRSGDVW
jgi:aminoglycoside 2'-N-acetyltransferase I